MVVMHGVFESLAGMTIAVTGASGFIGRALVPHLRACGATVLTVVRSHRRDDSTISWNVDAGTVGDGTERIAAFVHLAGAGLADKRWTKNRKSLLWSSRVDATRALAQHLARRAHPPKLFIHASGVGYYGNSQQRGTTESDPVGQGFLASLAHAWEAAAQEADRGQTRVSSLRLGMVVASDGGALAKMITPFRLGLGGALGSGLQGVSWIHRDDVIHLVGTMLASDWARGPYNVCSTQSASQIEFARTLAKVIRRPSFVKTPAWALRIALGEMADALLLSGQFATPKRLVDQGYHFRFTTLEAAIADVIVVR